jgi:signal transduction histidine kinase
MVVSHFGPYAFTVANQDVIRRHAPVDTVFAALATALLFLVLRHYLIAQQKAEETLRHSHDELELRVEERTRELDERRLRKRRILDAMPDGICIINQEHELEYVNPVLQREWGDAEGRKCYTYFSGGSEPCVNCCLPSVMAGKSARWEWACEGKQKTYEVIGALMREAQGSAADEKPAALYIYRDVTYQVQARKHIEEVGAKNAQQAEELRKAHAALSSRARELTTLLEVSHTLASTLQSRPLLEMILDQLKIMIDYAAAILYIAEGDGITAVAYRGALRDEQIKGLHIPLAHAPGFRKLLERREPVIVDDLYGDEDLACDIRTAGSRYFPQTLIGSRAWMGVPLMSGDRVTGMLRLDHLVPGNFSGPQARIAMAIANHAAVAIENARLYEEVRKVAVLEERQRMARDLHDSVSQSLYGIALGVHAAREQIERAPEKLNGTLEYVLSMSAMAVAEMRALVFELRPDSLEQEGLTTALAKLTDALRARTGAIVNVSLDEEPSIELAAKETLYRIAQEALQNVARHAHAGIVSLSLRCTGGWVLLEVEDDGMGFDPDGRFPGHYGLRTMYERALRLGGTLEIDSRPHQSTFVRARIPVSAAAA